MKTYVYINKHISRRIGNAEVIAVSEDLRMTTQFNTDNLLMENISQIVSNSKLGKITTPSQIVNHFSNIFKLAHKLKAFSLTIAIEA